MVVVFVITAVCANFIAPHDPLRISLSQSLLPPSWMEGGSKEYLLGTDQLGRDILSRLMFGARFTLIVALSAMALGAIIGTTIGLWAGYRGGWFERISMRAVDVTLGFPDILFAIFVAVLFGPSFAIVILVIGMTQWAHFARIVRAEGLAIRNRGFMVAARLTGASSMSIVARHVFPNVLNAVVVIATIQVSQAIIIEGTLSFIGAGIPAPTPSWGSMVSGGRNYLSDAWWLALAPAIAIALTTLSFNMLGDWLRDRLDPQLQNVMRASRLTR